jgi:lipoate-protein ligase A
MDKNTFFIETTCVNPWRNLALEAAIMERTPAGAVVFYLWQNARTVVIGRSQNAFKECRVSELEGDGGCLARRLSGGGAVYHDLGNLNFTFVADEALYDVKKQLDVVVRAVAKFGIQAAATGRNDIETTGAGPLAGRKFSGNAFRKTGGKGSHHGTIMVSVDSDAVARYLNVSPAKIKSKGVNSVKSRIVNLAELNPSISIAGLKAALRESFAETYGEPRALETDAAFNVRVDELGKTFASPEWKYGRNPPFEFQAERRFPWGGVEVKLDVKNNVINDAVLFSDALDADAIEALAQALKGVNFTEAAVRKAASAAAPDFAADICGLLFE